MRGGSLGFPSHAGRGALVGKSGRNVTPTTTTTSGRLDSTGGAGETTETTGMPHILFMALGLLQERLFNQTNGHVC